MNTIIETFGRIVGKQVYNNAPGRARGLLRTAYALVGMQAKYFPKKAYIPAREYMLAVSNCNIARSLRNLKQAAIVNVFLPCEILHAMGIQTVFPEGISVHLTAAASERVFIEIAEKNGVPESFCSYHKALIGAVESGLLPKPQYVLNTTLMCDANRLSFQRISEYFGIPRFCIDVPNKSNDETTAYVANQLREMTKFIEQKSGMTLDPDRLKEAVTRSASTIHNYREYLKLRRTRSVPSDMTTEMLPLFSNHVLLGTKESEDYAKMLVRDTQKLPETRKKKRLLWMHTMPNWQDSLNMIFREDRDLELIGCDLAFDSLIDMDPLHPYESMAKRLLESSFNGPAERRIGLALKFAKEMEACGVIYFNHWGCKSTMGAAQLAKKTMEANGIPTLILDGDGCDSSNVSDGQMVTRVQAFLEQLGEREE